MNFKHFHRRNGKKEQLHHESAAASTAPLSKQSSNQTAAGKQWKQDVCVVAVAVVIKQRTFNCHSRQKTVERAGLIQYMLISVDEHFHR